MNNQFLLALESAPTGAILVDAAGNIIWVNAEVERLFGYVRSELINQPVEALVPNGARERHAGVRTTYQATPLARRMGSGRDLHGIRRDGGEVPVEIALNPISTSEGQFVLCFVVDITERKRAERERDVLFEQLRQLNTELEERVLVRTAQLQTTQHQLELADRLASLGTMAAGVAHEINNPLSALVANAEYVLERLTNARLTLAEDSPHERWLDETVNAQRDLLSAASRITRIVADLKTFSRPEPASCKTIDVRDAIESAIRATEHEFRHRAKLSVRLKKVPLVSGDDMRLVQVIVNLLINAAHAIVPGGYATNTVAVTTQCDAQGRVVIEVMDSGCGMTPETQSKIFEPFFTTKAVGAGTGLGLSISHGIVCSLGGTLEVESQLANGTTFRITLPASEGQSLSPSPTQSQVRQHLGRLLIVDDEAIVRSALERVLDQHQLVSTGDAREALRWLEEDSRFDLILCDLMMPTMTGIDFYRALLATRPELARRIVFLTGGATTPRVHAFLNAVPNQHLQKPFEVQALRALVQQALALTR